MQPRSINRAAQVFTIAAMLGFSSLVFAEPSKQEINQTLQSGNIAKADMLMKEVIAAHPESAQAHFKYAEILTAEGKLDEARTELAHAEKLQPNLDFAKPAAIKELNHKLNQTHQTQQGGYHSTSPFVTWGIIAFIVIFLVVIVRALRRPQLQPNSAANPQTANGYAPQSGPYQGGYGPQGGGIGSGIVGGLATGAAVGAGIVAGEMLMHKMLDDDQPSSHDSFTRNQPAPDNFDDISGSDFVDNDSGWDSGSSDSDSGGDWS